MEAANIIKKNLFLKYFIIFTSFCRRFYEFIFNMFFNMLWKTIIIINFTTELLKIKWVIFSNFQYFRINRCFFLNISFYLSYVDNFTMTLIFLFSHKSFYKYFFFSTIFLKIHQRSRFSASFAFCSINILLGSTLSPISNENISSHAIASSDVTLSIVLVAGSIVVSQS